MMPAFSPAISEMVWPRNRSWSIAIGVTTATCASATLRRHIDWIDGELATRPWLVGEERSGADLFLFMLTRWGRLQEPPAWDSPNLGNHFDRMLQRPGVQRMMAEQGLE